MTDEEALQFVIDKCAEGDRTGNKQCYREAEAVFNARWPNPVYYEGGSWHIGNG